MVNGKWLQVLKSLAFVVLPKIAPPLLVFIVSIGIVYTYTGSTPKVFLGTTRIWMQAQRFTSAAADSQQYLNSPLTIGMSALATACEVIRSEVVASLAHDYAEKKLGKDCPSVDAIMGGITAQPVKDSDILRITYTHSDPKIALAVVESVVEAFFKENNITMSGSATRSIAYLDKQLKQARDNYAKTRENLRRFQETNNAVDIDSQLKDWMQQKSDIEKTLTEETQLVNARLSKIQYLETQLGFKAGDVMIVDALSKDELVKGLRATIAENQVKMIDLGSKYQAEHPRMKRLQASTDDTTKALASRMKDLIGRTDLKLSADNVSNGSETRGKMLDEIVEAQAAQISSEHRISSLKSMLQKVEGKLVQVPKQQLGVAELRRADEVAAHSLSAIEAQMQSMTLNESVALGTSNLHIIDRPCVIDQSPSNQKFGILICFILAALTAAAQFIMDPKVRNVKQINSLLPVPIAGWIPTFKTGTKVHDVLATLQKLSVVVKNWAETGQKVVIITSADALDGKSTLTYGLAMTLSEHGHRVLLIDANLEHPSLHIFCKQQASPGLADYIEQPSDATGIIRQINDHLSLIPAGRIVHGENVLGSRSFNKLLSRLQADVDIVLIDTPPSATSVNALILPDTSVHVIAVVRLGHTLRDSLKMLAAQLTLLPVLESVVVVNDAPEQTIAKSVLSPALGYQQDVRGVSDSGRDGAEPQTAVW